MSAPKPLPPSHTHPSLRHASLRHTTSSTDTLRPPPIRIAQRPPSTVPAYRPNPPAPCALDLERARKTPDRTFLAPRVWREFHAYQNPFGEPVDDAGAASSTLSLPVFPFEAGAGAGAGGTRRSPLSLVLAADESPALLTAHAVSLRSVSVASSQAAFGELGRASRFTEHLGVSGEAMWASGVDFEGAGVEAVEEFREKEEEGEGSGDGEERREKKRRWWRWKGVGARWARMTGFLRRRVAEGRACEGVGVSPRVV